MFAHRFLLLLSFISPLIRSALSPFNCYDFITNSAPSLDQCGSGPALSPVAGNGSSPFCDQSGCVFDLNSSFQGTFPTGISLDWTLSFWAVLDGPTQTLITILNPPSSPPSLKLQKVSNTLQLISSASVDSMSFSSSQWGDRVWTLIHCASKLTQTVYGALVENTLHYQSALFLTDLTGAANLLIGTDFLGNNPVHLIRRLNIYSSFLTPDTQPGIAQIYQGLHCLDFQIVPFCSDAYVHYMMQPSFVSAQTVIDSSPNASHAINGEDGTTSKDATVTQFGLYFDGASQITVNPLTPSPLSSLSFSVSVWMLFDPLYYSSKQTFFHDQADLLKVQFSPSRSQIEIDFAGSSFSADTFPLTNPGWKFFSFSHSLKTPSSRFCVVSFHGHIESSLISSGPFVVSGLTIGSSFYGTLRDFRIYNRFMGAETFAYPQLMDTLCASGSFFNLVSQVCESCHPSCLSCADSSNSLCGMCASGFQLAVVGVPGVCSPTEPQCHDACESCSGPQYYQCLTCSSPSIPAFSTGSGSCVYACSQVDPQLQLVSGQCQQTAIRVSLVNSYFDPQSNQLILHFSHPLLFNNLNPSDFTLSPSGFSVTLQNEFASPSYSLKLSLEVLSSFDHSQTVSITLSSANLRVTSSDHLLFSLYSLDPFELAPHYNPSQAIVDLLSVMGFVTENTSLVILVALLIAQSYFQISFQMLWALLHFNQLVFFAPLINLDFPPLLFLIMQPLRFSVGDLYLLVLLYQFLFSSQLAFLRSHPFSPNFSLHDFSSTSLLDNCGPLFLLVALQLCLLLLYCLLSFKFLSRYTWVRKARYICSGLKWSSFLRTFLEAMLQLVLFSLLNIYQVLGAHPHIALSNPLQWVSFALSGFILFSLFLFSFGVFRVLAHHPYELTNYSTPIFRGYGELYRNQNTSNGFLAQHYQVLFILRRLAIVFSLLFLPSIATLQLTTALALCILQIIVLHRVRPFMSKGDCIVSMICEVCLLGVYGTLGATQVVKWRFKIWLVWICGGFILLGNGIGFLILVGWKITDCKKERKKQQELRELREKAQRREDTSILSMIRPVGRSFPSRAPGVSMNSSKPRQSSLFQRRKNYDGRDRKLQEVEIGWTRGAHDKELKLSEV